MTTKLLKGLDLYIKQGGRIFGVLGLLLYDYLASGLVLFLIANPVLNSTQEPALSFLLFLLCLSMSIAMSAVAQSMLDRLIHKKLKIKDFGDLFEVLIGVTFMFLDVFIDGMIAPWFLYGESPMTYFYYMNEGTSAFLFAVIFFRLFSLISEPGVVILIGWELDKRKHHVSHSNNKQRKTSKHSKKRKKKFNPKSQDLRDSQSYYEDVLGRF